MSPLSLLDKCRPINIRGRADNCGRPATRTRLGRPFLGEICRLAATKTEITTMKKLLLAAATLSAFLATPTVAIDSENDWVMLELYWANGEGAEMATKGLVPEFPNGKVCNEALRRELLNHAGLSHADGGGNLYMCTPLKAWKYAT
jgi:hypothetical protein